MRTFAAARSWTVGPLRQVRAFGSARARACAASMVLLALLALPLALLALALPGLIAHAYQGAHVPLVSDFVHPATATLAVYQAHGRLVLSRIFLVVVAVAFATVLVLFRSDTRFLLTSFFSAETSPVNLAVFRIVLFGVLLREANTDRLLWLSQLPASLRFAPSGLKPVLPYLPISPAMVHIVGPLFLLACGLALIGAWTRVATVVALIAGAYVLGVPQFFGKVDHNHHLFWFLCLMAASRCGDALSVDSLFAAWRRADQGSTAPVAPARMYALPIRFAWILIGILYFFPGLWKFWSAGFDWAFSDNLKLRMYAKWLSLDGWQPFFRIDQYPPLYQAAALGTIVFELSFIVIIFLPYIRQLMALGGILFHSMIYMFMRISFFTLVSMYVIFFNWPPIFAWIGRRLFPCELVLLYDGNCGICRRTIASVRAFDLLGRISYVNMRDRAAPAQHNDGTVRESPLLLEMHVVQGQHRWAGITAYRAVAWRVPLLWPLVPLLRVPPVAALGQRIYRRVAGSRACHVVPPAAPVMNQRTRRPGVMGATIAVGGVLVAGNVLFGALQRDAAWPFACYPRFDGIQEPTSTTLQVVAQTSDGRVMPLDKETLRSGYGAAQIAALIDRTLDTDDPALLEQRLRTLWAVWTDAEPKLHQATKVQFFRMVLITNPERQQENPLDNDFLMELDL